MPRLKKIKVNRVKLFIEKFLNFGLNKNQINHYLYMISTAQKAIIRSIAKEQTSSLLRIMEERCMQVKKELEDDGYEVSFSDIAEAVAKEMIEWDRVKENPEKFLILLDDTNVSMIKHHLVQDYLGHPNSKEIWKTINIRDSAFERRN